ncbi:MAG: manganese efflux pump [Clostridia bacterium]|nr:manganese efflux pump [Clostridia bacterium]
MQYTKLFLIALSLSMDAFAGAVCKGLSVGKATVRQTLTVGAYFGVFQALMPTLGYWLADKFEHLITGVSHWVALVLLVLIGANMIKESFEKDEKVDCSFCFKAMLPLAVATSIDAMAVGVTFALVDVEIIPAALLIGVTTFALSAVGVKIGGIFGTKYKSKAELIGGIVLILMGVEIVLEHYGIIY